jgi:AraC family transcriptional regulator
MKTETIDRYIHSLNKVLSYIEKNSNEPQTLEQLAKVGGFSKYHFTGIFQALLGESPISYLRRIRLERAAFRLKLNHESVTDIALSSGFETNAAFSKSFRKRFNTTPSELIKNFQQSVSSIKLTKPEIITLPDTKVLFVKEIGNLNNATDKAWLKLFVYAYKLRRKSKINLLGKNVQRFGIVHDDPDITSEDKIRYDACISYQGDGIAVGKQINIKTIAGGRYASFLHIGPLEGIKAVCDSIKYWMIDNDVKLKDAPIFHRYLDIDTRKVKPEDLRSEVCVPLT